MKNIKKRYLIFGILFVIVIFIFLIIANKNNSVKISTVPVPAPQIPNQVKGSLPTISLNVKKADFSFPSNLPLLESNQTEIITSQEASKFASNLGFNNQPINTQDSVGGTTYIWSNDNASFVIYTKTRQIDYSINRITKTINKQLSDSDITKTGQDFLNKNFSISSAQANFSYFTFLNALNETIKPTTKINATVYQVNFSPIQSVYKIISVNPQQSSMYVWVLPDGTVAKAHIIELPALTKTPEVYGLKNYEQFTNSLSKAILINLDNGNISVSDINTTSMSNLEIDKIELVYLIDNNNSSFYQPVFLLTGSVNVSGISQKLAAQLYLPALVNQ